MPRGGHGCRCCECEFTPIFRCEHLSTPVYKTVEKWNVTASLPLLSCDAFPRARELLSEDEFEPYTTNGASFGTGIMVVDFGGRAFRVIPELWTLRNKNAIYNIAGVPVSYNAQQEVPDTALEESLSFGILTDEATATSTSLLVGYKNAASFGPGTHDVVFYSIRCDQTQFQADPYTPPGGVAATDSRYVYRHTITLGNSPRLVMSNSIGLVGEYGAATHEINIASPRQPDDVNYWVSCWSYLDRDRTPSPQSPASRPAVDPATYAGLALEKGSYVVRLTQSGRWSIDVETGGERNATTTHVVIKDGEEIGSISQATPTGHYLIKDSEAVDVGTISLTGSGTFKDPLTGSIGADSLSHFVVSRPSVVFAKIVGRRPMTINKSGQVPLSINYGPFSGNGTVAFCCFLATPGDVIQVDNRIGPASTLEWFYAVAQPDVVAANDTNLKSPAMVSFESFVIGEAERVDSRFYSQMLKPVASVGNSLNDPGRPEHLAASKASDLRSELESVQQQIAELEDELEMAASPEQAATIQDQIDSLSEQKADIEKRISFWDKTVAWASTVQASGNLFLPADVGTMHERDADTFTPSVPVDFEQAAESDDFSFFGMPATFYPSPPRRVTQCAAPRADQSHGSLIHGGHVIQSISVELEEFAHFYNNFVTERIDRTPVGTSVLNYYYGNARTFGKVLGGVQATQNVWVHRANNLAFNIGTGVTSSEGESATTSIPELIDSPLNYLEDFGASCTMKSTQAHLVARRAAYVYPDLDTATLGELVFDMYFRLAFDLKKSDPAGGETSVPWLGYWFAIRLTREQEALLVAGEEVRASGNSILISTNSTSYEARRTVHAIFRLAASV